MNIKTITIGFLISAMATSAVAKVPPWKNHNLKISVDRALQIEEVREVMRKLKMKYPGIDITQFKKARRNWPAHIYAEPMANMSDVALENISVGNYMLQTYKPWMNRKDKKGGLMSIVYIDKNRNVYACAATGANRYYEDNSVEVKRKFTQAASGFGGYYQPIDWNEPGYGYSMVYDPKTGHVLQEGAKTHTKWIGHWQKKWPIVMKDICPNMPRVGSPDENQTSRKYQHNYDVGEPIKFAPVLFKSDPFDPLLTVHYYKVYPPEEWAND